MRPVGAPLHRHSLLPETFLLRTKAVNFLLYVISFPVALTASPGEDNVQTPGILSPDLSDLRSPPRRGEALQAAQSGSGLPGAEPDGPPAAGLTYAAKFSCVSRSGSKTNSWLWGTCNMPRLGRAGGQGHGRGPGRQLAHPRQVRPGQPGFSPGPVRLPFEKARGEVGVVQASTFLKQTLYMYINRRQIDTTYFLYFLLHLCDPGFNSPLVTLRSPNTRSVCREARRVPTWQADSGGSEAPGRRDSRAQPRTLGAVRPQASHLHTRQETAKGKGVARKSQRPSPSGAGGQQHVAARPPPPVCHACCCRSPHRRRHSAAPGWGRGTVLAPGLATETAPKPPAGFWGGVQGTRPASQPGGQPHGDGERFPESGPLGSASLLAPEVRGLGTTTSTLLSR